MNAIERVAQDLKEMEAEMEAQRNRNPREETNEAAVATEESKSEEVITSNPEVQVPEAAVNEEVTPVPVEEPVKSKRNDWKGRANKAEKRMAGLKASSDNFKFQTRQEISQLKALVAQLQSAPAKEVDPFEGLFSQEDKDVIGDEAVDIIQKATKAASVNSTKKLEAEVKELKADAKERQERVSEEADSAAYDAFMSKLESKVSNYAAINLDPAFIESLQEVDYLSGYSKFELLRRAQESGDVARVAQFMKEFEDRANPGQKVLEERVGPTGAPSASVVEQAPPENIMKGSFIREHDANVTRGRFMGRQAEAKKIRLEIDKALAEGRVNFRI